MSNEQDVKKDEKKTSLEGVFWCALTIILIMPMNTTISILTIIAFLLFCLIKFLIFIYKL